METVSYGSSRKRLRLLVSGRVQGVFFRASTKERADLLGLRGWVRNVSTGQVEMEVEGMVSAVDEILEWARKGPVSARVVSVEVEAIPLSADSSGDFGIRG